MTKAPNTTRDQLRALMQTHVEKTAAAPTPLPRVATPAPQSKPTLPVPLASSPGRQSLRLVATELEKINGIIHNTLQQTGQRITMTDVLRAGLSRVGTSVPITAEEIRVLRASDGRRAHLKT